MRNAELAWQTFISANYLVMNYEFDNEIDALLRRQPAQGETAFATANSESSAHLDADEISAFAENALPQKIKERYTLHLADCERCRKKLSNSIALDSETETARAEEKHFIAAATIPWYRRLVAFPNLAYTLGALVLVFTGITVYTILQNSGGFNNAEMSRAYDKQSGGKGMSSDGDQAMSESYSSNAAMSPNTAMSNQAAMNSSAVSSNSSANVSNLPMPSAPTTLAANANASAPRDTIADKDLNLAAKPAAPSLRESLKSAKTEDSVAAGSPPLAKENVFQSDNEILTQQVQTQNSTVQNQAELTPDTRNATKRAQSPALRSERDKNSRAVEESKDDAAEKMSATTTVSGKTFKRENNVWYDTTYRSQPTLNITRGTTDYKKLDADLRGIAENLGGTVVIVWKSKAYRIQ